ncbi:MAG: hypothetical protein D6799_00940 [Bacteroidetes bacterium]|nr:MAG: hypothetical protein D6799_00940 [Bacteroidota bacterium]
MLRNGNVIELILMVLFFYSCHQSDNPKDFPNTPTSGEISIDADNTFSYVIQPAMELFASIYKNAKVMVRYKGEHACIDDLLKDSCKVIFLSRSLSEEELKLFRAKNIILHQTCVARTGIVLLGRLFAKSGITMERMKNILSGKENVNVVFFGNDNGAVLYCKDSLLSGRNFGKNCFSIGDTSAFREYVLLHDDVIGIMDYTLICDDDDKWTRSIKYFRGDTLVVPVRLKEGLPAYYPDQSNIATGDYPITRCIYCIRRGDNFSLSAGIEAFVAGEKGQILFKKMGLVPVFDRERRIEIKPY